MLGKCLNLVRKRKSTRGKAEEKGEDGGHLTEPAAATLEKREPVTEHRHDNQKDYSDEEDGSDCSGADSLASIDTISDVGSDEGSDVERERNWRVRKILKYSRWQREVDPSTSRGEKRAKDIERRIAEQEEKLRGLEDRRPKGLEVIEEEDPDECGARDPVPSSS